MQDNPQRQFDTDLVIQYDSKVSQTLDKDFWRVVKSFTFTVGEGEKAYSVHVPAGFLTDGASVPRPFWWLLPPWSSYGQAAVMHDLLCETMVQTVNGAEEPINRAHADWLFREAMKLCGVSYVKRTIMYWGVRFFTGLHMRWHRKRYAQKAVFEQQWLAQQQS